MNHQEDRLHPDARRATDLGRDISRLAAHIHAANYRWLVLIHEKHWADGGETRLDNLVLLCSHHHVLVHEGGFGCEVRDGTLYFSTPDGAHLANAHALKGLDEQCETQANFEDEHTGFAIDADTCLPEWHGDDMDYDHALQALYDLRVRARNETQHPESDRTGKAVHRRPGPDSRYSQAT